MSVGYTNIALPGLSGYDFSGIVDTMVQNYSLPLNKMQTRQTALETKKNAWRDINTRLSALETTLDKLRDKSTWNATSASSGNSDILNAASSAGTVKGTYNIKVESIAVAQTAVSAVQDVADVSSATNVTEGTFSITVGEKTTEIDISAGAAMEEIAEAINNAKAGVNASVVKVDGGYRLAVVSEDTGTEKAAVFAEEGGGTVLHSLGIIKTDDSLNVSQPAEDASLVVNGIQNITSNSNTVTSAIPGLTLNLNSADPDATVSVTVSANYSEAQGAIKKFVDQYNSVMSFIEQKTRYNDETKVKGDLFGDPVLQGIQSRLRSMIGGRMNNPSEPFNILSQVGISTSSESFGKSAVLEFDTAKFQEALDENADSVANLFGAAAGGVEPITENSDTEQAQGLANVLREYLHPMVMYDGSIGQTEESYERQIKQVKEEIADFTERIEDYAERTRLKFAALETQLMGLSSQGEWLSSQINAMDAFNKEDK